MTLTETTIERVVAASRSIARPIGMREACRRCGKRVQSMAFKGSGYCSTACLEDRRA